MPSTYSANLKVELIATGEKTGTWGDITNSNLGTLLEQAIAGYVTQGVTDGAATVLTIPDGASSNGRNYVIELTGSLSAARTVEVPAVDKPYIFFNNTTGGFSVTVKVTGQTGVVIANGKKAVVYTNSTDVIEVVNAPVSEAGTQTLTNKTLTEPTIIGTAIEDIFTITDGASVDIDPSNGSVQLWTLGASRTPVLPTSWTAGQGITLMVNDGTAYTITWTTMGVVWVGGTAPTLALTGYTVIEFWKVSSTIYGARVGNVA